MSAHPSDPGVRSEWLARLAAPLLFVALASAPLAHDGLHDQIAEATERLASKPNEAVLHLRRATLYRLHGQLALAESDLARAHELAPALAGLALERATTALAAGDPMRALGYAGEVPTGAPLHGAALLVRARSWKAIGHLAAAERDFDAALALHSSPKPEYFLERAEVTARRDPARALAGLDAAMAQLGITPSLQQRAIELEIEAGRVDAALARLETLAAQSTRKERWLFERGEILAAADRPREARQAFESSRAAIRSLKSKRRNTAAALELIEKIEARLAFLPPTSPPNADS